METILAQAATQSTDVGVGAGILGGVSVVGAVVWLFTKFIPDMMNRQSQQMEKYEQLLDRQAERHIEATRELTKHCKEELATALAGQEKVAQCLERGMQAVAKAVENLANVARNSN